MTWFFERQSEVAVCEVRRGLSHFEIAIRRDGIETVSVAQSATELLTQLEHAPRALLQDGWRPRAARAA